MCRAKIFSATVIARTCRGDSRPRLQSAEENFPLHPRHIERKQPAVFDHLPRNLIFSSSEFAERNLFPAANAVDQGKFVEVSRPRFWQFCL